MKQLLSLGRSWWSQCTGHRCRLTLWLWSLHSGRALSQAIALFGLPLGWTGLKNERKCVFCVGMRRGRRAGMRWRNSVGNLQNVKLGTRQEKKERILALDVSADLIHYVGETRTESHLVVWRIFISTYCSTFSVIRTSSFSCYERWRICETSQVWTIQHNHVIMESVLRGVSMNSFYQYFTLDIGLFFS